MNPFLLYLIKSTALLSVFYSFFLLVMRRTSFFRFNRIALLAGTALCLALPLVPVRIGGPTLYSEFLAAGVVTAVLEAAPAGTGTLAGPGFWTLGNILMLAYLAGAAVVLAVSIRSYFRLLRLLHQTPWAWKEGCRLHLVDRELPSLSWMRDIVMSCDDAARFPSIFMHERAHVQCRHSLDLLLYSLVSVLQWFNPLVWICRSELKLLHEYEADERVLRQGIDATQYQLLLVKKTVGEKRFLLANGFNHSQLKNRIAMMQITPSAAWKRLSLLLVLPFLAGVTLLFADNSEVSPAAADVLSVSAEVPVVADVPAAATLPQDHRTANITDFSVVEVKPTFQGKDANEFTKWVSTQLVYPEEAKNEKIQGRVTAAFTIASDGSVKDVEVLRGVDPRLDAEAVRVLSSSPKWEPGKVGGKPVSVRFTFPVIFQLKGSDESKPQALTVSSRRMSEGDPSIRTETIPGQVVIFVDGKQVKDMNDLDPKDIESIDIFKDAASIAQYTTEKVGGVILVHLKKK